jgi:hypothetical protein
MGAAPARVPIRISPVPPARGVRVFLPLGCFNAYLLYGKILIALTHDRLSSATVHCITSMTTGRTPRNFHEPNAGGAELRPVL